MPPVYCQNCKQLFTKYSSFQKHLDAKEPCFNAFVARNAVGNGLSRPNKRSRHYKQVSESKQEFLKGVEKLLVLEEKEALLKRELNAAYSDLDFDAEKVLPPPGKILRIGNLPPLERTKEKGLHSVVDGNKTLASFTEALTTLDDSAENHLENGINNCENGNLPAVEGNVASANPAIASDTAAPVDASNNTNNNNEDALHHDPQDDEDEDFGNQLPMEEVEEVQESMLDEGPLQDYKEYVTKAKTEFSSLSKDMKACIELMDLMNEKGGSTALYDEIMRWHMAHLKQEKPINSEKLHQLLMDRYHLGPVLPKERQTTLPFSKEITNLPCHDAKAQLVNLLTDPRICDEDYLFVGDDPMAGIPEEFERVGDVNTGLAYRETFKALIEPNPITECGRRKVLCPIIFYIDGCVTGNYMNLNIEILKFTVGILKGKTRDKDYAWRNLGYVRKRCRRNQEAAQNIQDSKHVDANMFIKDPEHRSKQYAQMDGPAPQFDWKLYSRQQTRRKKKKQAPSYNAQDFHSMLQTIMGSYKRLEDEGGLPWDLRYRGQTYHIVLLPFIVFIKADSVEADKICGAYGSKTEGVGCLCRFCCIPTAQTDDPYVDPEPVTKTQDLILDLVKTATSVDDNDPAAPVAAKEAAKEASKKLQGMSQHKLWNVFYQFRFGMHNNAGVHGATPWEILHWILLGLFKYDREALFLQTGESSKLSARLDALAQTYGHFLDRQSDRNLPRVAFSDGIRQGKMCGHEMVGVILLLGVAMRSRAGRDLILDKAYGIQKEHFPTDQSIKDWVRMLESHLMFERWLRQDEYSVAVLNRAKSKLREFMQFTKSVGRRDKGMGYNTANYHCTLHMPDLAINICAFRHFNTESDESHHKKDKKTAKRTNMQMDSFDITHARKVVYRQAIEYAKEEMCNGSIAKWEYWHRGLDVPEPSPSWWPPRLRGPKVSFSYSDDEGRWKSKVYSEMVGKERYVYDENTLAYILALANDVREQHQITTVQAYGTLEVFSNTRENGVQPFYAKPYAGGKPWNDWAIFDLSDSASEFPTARKRVPAHIKCFLDFSRLPADNALMKPPGIYAIVEPTLANNEHDEKWWSQLWDPCCKEQCTVAGYEGSNKQELVSITKIVDTAVVVPDHANPNPRAFLRMVPISLWAEMFENWIMRDATDDNDAVAG